MSSHSNHQKIGSLTQHGEVMDVFECGLEPSQRTELVGIQKQTSALLLELLLLPVGAVCIHSSMSILRTDSSVVLCCFEANVYRC